MHRFSAVALQPMLNALKRFYKSAYENTVKHGPMVLGSADNGWHCAGYDVGQLLQVFETLELKPGYMLKAWHYSAGGNGRGLAVVMPAGSQAPDIPQEPRHPFPLERFPQGSSLTAWHFVQGRAPRSARTYLEASLFMRHVLELVPLWHDSQWHEEQLIFDNPNVVVNEGVQAPAFWEPSVNLFEGGAEVVFHTVTFGSVRQYRDRWLADLRLSDETVPMHATMNGTYVIGEGARPPH